MKDIIFLRTNSNAGLVLTNKSDPLGVAYISSNKVCNMNILDSVDNYFHARLHNAINNQIMDLRVRHLAGDIKDLDKELFGLQHAIYEGIKQALELKRGC